MMKNLVAASFCVSLLACAGSVVLRANPPQLPTRASLAPTPPDTGQLRALLKNERIAEAARAAEHACTGEGSNASLLVTCGDVWFRQGQLAKAARMYAAAIAGDSTSARGYWGLGRIDLLERRNRSARQHFEKAHALDPGDPNILLDWALARPSRPQQVGAAERYLALAANGNLEERALAGIRTRIAILAALGPGDTFVVADPGRAYRLELHEARSPEGPLNSYRLFALVNGQKLRLTLDTGTSGIYINRKAAERSRLVRIADGVPVGGVGDERPHPTSVALADVVQIGDLEMRRCEITVDSGQAVDDGDGLIGTDVFSRFLVRLNFPAHVMELTPLPTGERSIAEDFWGVERRVTPGFTPVHVFGHLLLADACIDNVPDVLMVIDSGAPSPVLSTAVASRIPGLHMTSAVVRGISGRVRQMLTTGPVSLAFANLLATSGRFPAVNLDEQNRRQGMEIAGVIGLDLLRQFDLTIDYTNGLVRLDHQTR